MCEYLLKNKTKYIGTLTGKAFLHVLMLNLFEARHFLAGTKGCSWGVEYKSNQQSNKLILIAHNY